MWEAASGHRAPPPERHYLGFGHPGRRLECLSGAGPGRRNARI